MEFYKKTGESNYLLNRNQFNIKKSTFIRFYQDYKKKIGENKLKKNTLSLYFFTGTK